MLSLPSATVAMNVAEPSEALAPARAYRGTVTMQLHAPASTVVHLSAGGASGASGVSSDDASPLVDSGLAARSLPATLCRMGDIALAAASGTLTSDDQARLAAEYAQLSQGASHAVASAIQERAQAEAAAQAQAQAQEQAQAQAHANQVTAATSGQDASAQGDATSGQRSQQSVALHPDIAVSATPSVSAALHAQDPAQPAATEQRLQSVQTAALTQFQRQSAAPRPVLSVVA